MDYTNTANYLPPRDLPEMRGLGGFVFQIFISNPPTPARPHPLSGETHPPDTAESQKLTPCALHSREHARQSTGATAQRMNGPIAFGRTIRALDADGFRISNFILLFALALLGGWIWWFARADVPQYEISRDVRIEPNRFIVTFPARVLDHVRPGQSATLQLNGATIPAKVIAIGMDASSGQVRAILLPLTETAPPAGTNAEAAVEIERVSPATLVLRASGRANR